MLVKHFSGLANNKVKDDIGLSVNMAGKNFKN